MVHLLMANVGFFVSFAVLLLNAIYEDDLNRLFHNM